MSVRCETHTHFLVNKIDNLLTKKWINPLFVKLTIGETGLIKFMI